MALSSYNEKLPRPRCSSDRLVAGRFLPLLLGIGGGDAGSSGRERKILEMEWCGWTEEAVVEPVLVRLGQGRGQVDMFRDLGERGSETVERRR